MLNLRCPRFGLRGNERAAACDKIQMSVLILRHVCYPAVSAKSAHRLLLVSRETTNTLSTVITVQHNPTMKSVFYCHPQRFWTLSKHSYNVNINPNLHEYRCDLQWSLAAQFGYWAESKLCSSNRDPFTAAFRRSTSCGRSHQPSSKSSGHTHLPETHPQEREIPGSWTQSSGGMLYVCVCVFNFN